MTTQDVQPQAAIPHEIDEEELIPDYGQILAEGPTLHQAEIPITAMDVEPQGYTSRTERTAEGDVQTQAGARDPSSLPSGVTVNDAVFRASLNRAVTERVSNIVQAQMAPLFHQLFDRMEAMETRQIALDEQARETYRTMSIEAEARQARLDEQARVSNQRLSAEAEVHDLAGNLEQAMRIKEVPRREVDQLLSSPAAGNIGGSGPREHSSVVRGRRALESLREQSRDEAPLVNPKDSERADLVPTTGHSQALGREQSGVVEVGGVPHAWRLTSDGLKLEPLNNKSQSPSLGQPSSQSVFTSRAPSPFEPVNTAPKDSKTLRSRSGSPLKPRAASEGRGCDVKLSRGLRATISEPMPPRAPVVESPSLESPNQFLKPKKPKIVYPLSPGGTEIRPPSGVPPPSPDPKPEPQVLRPPSQMQYPWPTTGGVAWNEVPFTSPPRIPASMRASSVGAQGSGIGVNTVPASATGEGVGCSGSAPQGSSGLEWFFDGMKRALTSQGHDMDGKAEEVKTSQLELPKLVVNEQDKEISPLIAGDWLTLAGPVMRDLSANSTEWWSQVTQAASEHYQRWLLATPVERLSLRPSNPGRFEGTKFARVEQRGLQLMLKSIPTSLRDELVSTQRMTSIDLIALVYSTFQPGGLRERSALLRFLTSPDSANDVASALKQIKRWSRWRRRAEQLSVAVPDPTLLLAGLEGLTSKVLSKHTEATFRLSSFRYAQNVDVAPTLAKVCDLADMIQAELEALGTGTAKPTKAAKADAAPEAPKGKGLSTKPKCKHRLTPGGCHYGRACTFAHSALGKGDKRCFNCSSTEHYKEACPFPQKAPEPGENEKGKGKGKKGGKKGSGDDSKTRNTPNTVAAAADSNVASSVAEGSAKPISSEEARQNMYKEVTEAIKQLTATPSTPATAKRLKEYPLLNGTRGSRPVTGQPLGLLDSGASTCVRPQTPEDEVVAWRVVALAEGETKMAVNQWGTLLSTLDSEPIVAMSKLVRMGFHVAWKRQLCLVVHPELGRVPVMVVDGCPRVERRVALDLIRRIELWEETMQGSPETQGERVALIQQKLRDQDPAVLAEGLCQALGEANGENVAAWIEALVRAMFPGTPDRITREVSQYATPAPEALCWNRRTRRTLERSEGVIVHLCCGTCRGEFQAAAAQHGLVVLDIDRKEDLNNPHTASYLLRLAALGKLKGVMSGLPCRPEKQTSWASGDP